jgi:V/A-type H+-transporting ATPase subunit E
MSLERVVEDIKEEANARAAEIRQAAEREAEQMREAAREDAAQLREERLAEAERTIEQEREQQLSSAKLEAKQSRLEARRDVLGSVREEVEQRLADLDAEERETLTRQLLDGVAGEFGDDATVRVYGRESDRDLIESLLSEYDGFEYAGSVDCLGGVVVESEASRMRITNTFDSVLESTWDDSIGEMSDRLFEENE